MWFEINENGRIMVCADTLVKTDMLWLPIPGGFTPDAMHDWRVVDGALAYDPLPVEVRPTPEERIAALEEELLAAKILLGLEA